MADRKVLYRDPITGHVSEIAVSIDDATPTHNGELLIWDSVAQAYIPGDPLVQGLYPAGSSITSPPINPVLVGGSDGTYLRNLSTNASGALNVVSVAQANTTDVNNTTTTPLAANGVFSGTSTDVTNHATVEVGIYSNVPSATNGVVLQWSPDGTNWDYFTDLTYSPGGVGLTIPTPVLSKYFKISYTNGATLQTSFRLYALLIPVSVLAPTQVLSQFPTSNNLALLTRSVLTGKWVAGSGAYYNVGCDSNGALDINLRDLGGSAVGAANPLAVSLPTATVTTLTPVTAAAIASAIVSNPPTTFGGVVTNAGTFAVQAACTGTVTVSGTATVTPAMATVWQVSPTSAANTASNPFYNAVVKTALTPGSPTAASVGVTSGSALAANASRKGLVLVNTSANYISLGFGAAAVLYSGITLNPSGGTFVMDEFTFCTSQIYAVASGATSNLGIQEMA